MKINANQMKSRKQDTFRKSFFLHRVTPGKLAFCVLFVISAQQYGHHLRTPHNYFQAFSDPHKMGPDPPVENHGSRLSSVVIPYFVVQYNLLMPNVLHCTWQQSHGGLCCHRAEYMAAFQVLNGHFKT